MKTLKYFVSASLVLLFSGCHIGAEFAEVPDSGDADSSSSDADTDSDSDADTDADSDADSDGDSDSDVDTDSDTDNDVDTDTDTDTNTDADNDTDTDSDVDADTDGDTALDTDSASNNDTDIGTESDTDAPQGCSGCYINGTCYENKSSNPQNACLLCDVAVADNVWTNDDGKACDDLSYCTVDDVCSDGQCSGTPRDCSDNVECNGLETCDDEDESCADGTLRDPLKLQLLENKNEKSVFKRNSPDNTIVIGA